MTWYNEEARRGYTADEIRAARENKGILAPAPPQWSKTMLQDYTSRFLNINIEPLSKEILLTFAGQLQRYGGVYYMGLAREVRQWLYAHFQLVSTSGSQETHI